MGDKKFQKYFDDMDEAITAAAQWKRDNAPTPVPLALEELYRMGKQRLERLGSEQDIDPFFANWLAGFIDGEAAFDVKNRRPFFSLGLREDDADVLLTIVEQTGLGDVYWKKKQEPSATKNTRPQAVWRLERTRDCANLVVLLDAHPLRSKKARDYVIWRKIVLVQCGRPGHRYQVGRLGQLPREPAEVREVDRLEKELREGRQYRPPPSTGDLRLRTGRRQRIPPGWIDEVVKMRQEEGLTLEQIAERTGVRPSTTTTRLKKAGISFRGIPVERSAGAASTVSVQ